MVSGGNTPSSKGLVPQEERYQSATHLSIENRVVSLNPLSWDLGGCIWGSGGLHQSSPRARVMTVGSPFPWPSLTYFC